MKNIEIKRETILRHILSYKILLINLMKTNLIFTKSKTFDLKLKYFRWRFKINMFFIIVRCFNTMKKSPK